MPTATPLAAQRNESFWQISSPPSCFRSIARILPGYGAANATCCLPAPPLVKTVMKRLSPVISRLPAPSSAPMTPDRCCPLPSPKIVSIWIDGFMYIIEPASAIALSPGSSSISTNCISVPRMRKSTSCCCFNVGLLRFRREILAGVDEAIHFELVLLVVQLAVPPVHRQELGMGPALDDLAGLEDQNLI